MHELIDMYEKPIGILRLEEVRDVYVFCCFTGYAYETVYNLEPANILKVYIVGYGLQNTGRKLALKKQFHYYLSPWQLLRNTKIIHCIDENKLLPVNSNVRYNAYIKEVATICGIKKELTTHTARHTLQQRFFLKMMCPSKR